MRGNDTYTQSTTNASNGNGVVDERTIFVHGTWSNPKKAFDSSFRDGVRDILQDDRQEDFVWSGKNLNSYREKAARDLLLQINQPYKYKDGEELNIVTHSHGGNVAKLLSQAYDYANSPKLNIFNFGTPNREDYVMSPKVEKFYNIYNEHDWLVQKLLGRVDVQFNQEEGKYEIEKGYKIEKTLTQEATESNAINVAVKRDSTIKIFTPSHLLRGYILLKGGYDNHSNFKDIQTLEVLKSYMENNK